MEPPPAPAERFWLDDRLVEPAANEIDGHRTDSKAMNVLVCLARAAPGVVSHAQLLESVWPNVVVGDNVLHQAIAHLRKILGDNARSPKFIETVPRRGYRLLANVRFEQDGGNGPDSRLADDPAATTPADGGRIRRIRVAAGFLAALLLGAGGWLMTGERQPATQHLAVPEHSVAVLPFANIGPDPSHAYFSDGLSEELIHLLARNPQLKVTSRTSAFHFKDRALDLPSIARQLGVAHILEGSVRASGDRVRVSVLLVDARTDTPLWSETYDRRLTDVLVLQDEIARQVFARLRLTLGPPARRAAVDPQAYLRYLQARYLLGLEGADSGQQAIALLDEALAIDRGFVAAWAQRSRAHWQLGDHEAADRDKARAAELDPDDPVVNGFHGWEAFWQGANRHDLAQAAAHYTRALAADPTNVDVLRPMTALLIRLGRLSEAIAVSHWLLSRDPLCVICRNNLGQAHLAAGRFAAADQAWTEALAVAPDSTTARAYLAWSQLLQGRPQEALTTAEGRPSSEYVTPFFDWLRALARYHLGESAAALPALEALQATWGDRYPYLFTISHAMTGDLDAAFAWLERSADHPPFDMAFPHLTGGLRALHDDPRWPAALERFGLSPQQLQRIEMVFALPALEP